MELPRNIQLKGLIDQEMPKMESKIDSLDGSPPERGAEKVYVPCLIYICIYGSNINTKFLLKKLQGIFWKGQFAAGTDQ